MPIASFHSDCNGRSSLRRLPDPPEWPYTPTGLPVWAHGPGAKIWSGDSKSLWRQTPRPNIVPHSIVGFRRGAPTTFSMMYGMPSFWSLSRVGPTRSG
jgi:hypothetical protein